MAIAAGTIWECNASATASNLNGGGFNPTNANFISNFAATAANTSAPVITSASYTFVAGDVGAWFYVKSGTSWTAGFYQIASVAGGAATLNAAVGAAVQLNTTTNRYGASTVVGCATVASPTGGTCGIDYSQGTAAITNNTDLASTTGTTNPSTITSAGSPFGLNHVGNIIHVTAGTNWTAGWYEIVSVSGIIATLDRAVGSAAVLLNGTFYLGGAMSLGAADDDTVFENSVAGNRWFIKSGTYTLGGAVSVSKNGTTALVVYLLGYASLRGDAPVGTTRPLFDCGGNQIVFGQNWHIRNMRFTGANATRTFLLQPTSSVFYCQFRNTANATALYMQGGTSALGCEMSSYGGAGGIAVDCTSYNMLMGCTIHGCAVGLQMGTGFSVSIVDCLFYGCKTKCIDITATADFNVLVYGCTFYGTQAKSGIAISVAANAYGPRLLNNIFYGFTTGVSVSTTANTIGIDDYNDYYNNTTDVTNWYKGRNDVAVDPSFQSVANVTGTTATTAGGILTDSSANFSAVVDNQDFVQIISGTGVTAGFYLITAHTTTTITCSGISNNATADKVYVVVTGKNFAVGTALLGLGFPEGYPNNSGTATTSTDADIGAAQRTESTTAGGRSYYLGKSF